MLLHNVLATPALNGDLSDGFPSPHAPEKQLSRGARTLFEQLGLRVGCRFMGRVAPTSTLKIGLLPRPGPS